MRYCTCHASRRHAQVRCITSGRRPCVSYDESLCTDHWGCSPLGEARGLARRRPTEPTGALGGRRRGFVQGTLSRERTATTPVPAQGILALTPTLAHALTLSPAKAHSPESEPTGDRLGLGLDLDALLCTPSTVGVMDEDPNPNSNRNPSPRSRPRPRPRPRPCPRPDPNPDPNPRGSLGRATAALPPPPRRPRTPRCEPST